MSQYSEFLNELSVLLIEKGFEHMPGWFTERPMIPGLFFIKDGDSDKLIFGTLPADWDQEIIGDLATPLRRFHMITFCVFDGEAWYCPFAIEVTVDSEDKLVDIRPTDHSIDGYRIAAGDFMKAIKKLKDDLNTQTP